MRMTARSGVDCVKLNNEKTDRLGVKLTTDKTARPGVDCVKLNNEKTPTLGVDYIKLNMDLSSSTFTLKESCFIT